MVRTVTWENQGRVAIVHLSNPPINSVNWRLLKDLGQTLDEIEKSEEVRVLLIVSTNSKIFAVGRNERIERIDRSEVNQQVETKLLSSVLKRLADQPIPTISIISGNAIGAGFELALACDLRVSSEISKFGFYNDVSPTSFSSATLKELTGPAKAKELMWVGQLIGAQEAVDVGVVNRIFTEDHLMNEGLEMAYSMIHSKK